MSEMRNTVKLHWLPAVTVLLLAWGLFLVGLDKESLWYDEWISWTFSQMASPIALIKATPNRAHPPTYYLWLWTWVRLTGSDTVFVMRLAAVVPALLTVALVYRLAVRWFRSHWAGIGAAAFLARSGIFIYYARELRMYTLVALLATLSWYLLWRIQHGKRWAWLGYAAVVTLMGYSYYYLAVLVAVQALYMLVLYRQLWRELAKAYGLTLLVMLPWLPTFYDQVILLGHRAGRDGGFFNSLGKFGTTQPTNLESLTDFLNTYSSRQPVFVLMFIAMALLLGFSAHRIHCYRRRLGMLVFWLFLTVGLFFGVNFTTPFYSVRYIFMIVPSVALLVGVAIHLLPHQARGGVVALVIVTGLFTYTDAFLPEKTPHKELLSTIEAGFQPGDKIWYNFAFGGLGSSLEYEVTYYLENVTPHLHSDDFVWNAPEDFADVTITPRVWDVRPYWIPIPADVAAVLQAGRVVTEQQIFGAYGVRLYEAPPQVEPVAIGDLFRLRPEPVADGEYVAGAALEVDTWWQAIKAPELDYSYTLHLRYAADESLVAQVDDGLRLGDLPSSQWPVGAGYALSRETITLPADLPPGTYEVWLAVYYWETPDERLTVEEDTPYVVDDLQFIRLGSITTVS